MHKAFGCGVLMVVLAAGVWAQEQPQANGEQHTFLSAHAKMDKPVPLPADVKGALGKDEAVLSKLRTEKLDAARLPDGWFTASLLHTEGGEILVVEAERPLYDEYETKFWIFTKTATGFELVLDEVGRKLEIAPEGEHPVIHVTKEHYHIYPSTSYRWRDGHYSAIIVK